MSEERPPLLRVVKGDPSPEELAALVAVVTARLSAAPPPRAAAPARRWAGHHLKLRRPIAAGPGGWRDSRWNFGGLQ